jgi:hypothetical protein
VISAASLLFGIVTAMSMETRSTKRNRVYKRKFDHDLAIELHEKGFNYNEIRRHLGNVVSTTAIARVCNPEIRRRMDAAVVKNMMSGSCLDCGKTCAKHAKRCPECSAKARQTRYITDEDDNVVAVHCSSCKQWKPPTLFQKSKKSSRGFYQQCRSCSTASRQRFRERRKVPCLYCGAPALPPEEKGSTGGKEPRCRNCFEEHLRLGV